MCSFLKPALSIFALKKKIVVQRYEGASTLYGPWTLAAYQQEYANLATAMINNKPAPAGPTPPDLSSQTVSSLFFSILFTINKFYPMEEY